MNIQSMAVALENLAFDQFPETTLHDLKSSDPAQGAVLAFLDSIPVRVLLAGLTGLRKAKAKNEHKTKKPPTNKAEVMSADHNSLDDTLLKALESGEKSIGELVEIGGFTKPVIRRRLQVLEDSKQIGRSGEKRGTKYFLRQQTLTTTDPGPNGVSAAVATV